MKHNGDESENGRKQQTHTKMINSMTMPFLCSMLQTIVTFIRNDLQIFRVYNSYVCERESVRGFNAWEI